MSVTAHEITQRLDRQSSEIAAASALWRNLFSAGSAVVPCPSESQWRLWLELFTLSVVVEGIHGTAKHWQKTGCYMDQDHAIRFCSKICNTRSRLLRAAEVRHANN